jgi:outer membrane immunogenic protein
MKKLVMAAAAAVLFCAPALAADLAAKASPRALFDWSGFYVGGNAGYGFSSSDSSLNFPPVLTINGDTDPKGGIYGGHFGAQKQFSNNWVLGAQVTLLGASMKDTSPVTFNGAAFGLNKGIKISAIGLAEAKLGYAMESGSMPTLPYVTAGAACARSDTSLSVGGLGSITSNKADACGWTIGAGVDWALATPGWIFGVKYNYADLRSVDHSFPIIGGIGLSLPDKQTLNLLQAQVSYKF